MAISEAYTNAATISTSEWSLTTNTAGPDVDTTDGIYQVFLDLATLIVNDIFEFKLYEKTTAGSTQRVVYSCRFAGVQGAPVWASPSFILLHGWDVTLKKISGTDRSIAWSIRKVA